jgi:hypothetical protein
MKTLTTYTKNQLEEMKLAEITDINNSFANELGLKITKRFASKDKAVTRAIQNQDLYSEEFAEQHKNKATKAVAKIEKAKKNEQAKEDKIHNLAKSAKVISVLDKGKECSIENSLHHGISIGEDTVEKLVNYIVNNHRRPRSGLGVDAQYATHNIKWFVNKGHLKLEE